MRIFIRNFGTRFLVAGLLLPWLTGTRVHAQAGPTLVSSSPANGATGVALDSKISFTFSDAMKAQENISWNGNGFDTNKLSYSWSSDAKTLTCSYSGNLPSATLINWTLFPTIPMFSAGFEDLAGNPLSFTPFPLGSFTTASGGGGTNDCSGSSTNANVTVFSLNKSAAYLQNSVAAPTPDNSSTDPFIFSATVNLATGRTATSVTLTPPGSPAQTMDTFLGGSLYFIFATTNDLAQLNALYPAGAYTFAVTGTPNQTVTANLPATVPPNAPHVSNYAAAQTINAGSAFTLAWDAFAGGLPTDSITVDIYNSSQTMVFQITNSAGCPSVLPGTAISVVLPANTLSSNQTYSAQINFLKSSVTSNASPASVTIVGGSSMTDVTIATFAGGVTPPPAMVLTNAVWLPTGQFQFEFPSAPGTSYTVEYTSDLGNPLGWSSLPPTNATGNLIQITDTPPQGTSPRIYRTRHN